MRHPLPLFLAWSTLGALAVAEDKTFTHRITGLFSPERQAALEKVVADLSAERLPGIALVGVDFDHAEGEFRYDPAIAFKGTEPKPEKLTERLNNEIRHASRHTLGVAPRVEIPRGKLRRAAISARGIDCQACGLVAYETVAKIDGVAQAAVDFKKGQISLLFDPEKTNEAAIKEALTGRGIALGD